MNTPSEQDTRAIDGPNRARRPDDPAPTGFFATLVYRPVALGMLFLTCLIVGWIAYTRIPIQLMPGGMVEPGLQVFVANPGASAPENEEQVTRVLEEELRTLPGIAHIFSGSNPDSVWIWVEFDADTDMDLAKAEVRDRIERARPRLPDTVQNVGIWSWNESDMPIMYFALKHPGDSDRTDFLIDTIIQPRIEAVDGVGRVEVHGILDDSVRILLDEDRVRAANLDLGALIRRLSSDNFALPMGEVSDGGRRILLRSDMRFSNPEEIERYPVGNGLTLGDLGEVIKAKSVRNYYFRLDGSYSYFGEVQKDGQANVVATCERLRAAVEELKQDPKLAGEFDLHVVFDQGEFIEQSLAQLSNTALQGGGLAILVLLVFLRRVRLTICVAMSIPVSILLAIAWAYFTGGTFNVLTMTGVTLAMGMLVDNSVVVTENITRLAAERFGPGEGKLASIAGVREVGLAVLLSTLTTVVVFLPMIFMTENPLLRIIFGEIGLPLCISLLISLLVALVFMPVAVARIVAPRPKALAAIGNLFAPLVALPGRLVGLVIGLVRVANFTLVQAVYRVERLIVVVLAPLRWILAPAVLAFAVYQVRGLPAAYELAAPLESVGAGAGPVQPLIVGYIGAGVVAALVLLLGLGRWRRRAPRPPARPARFVPAGHSILDFLIEGNRTLVAWSLDHRLLATVFAGGALISVMWPSSQMEVTPFGQDESSNRVRVYVDLEGNFTLDQASEEFARYEDYLETRREDFGFAHVSVRFDDEDGRIDMYWDGRRLPEERDAVIADLRKSLPRHAGHDVSFLGDERENQESRSLVTFRITGTDSEELARLGQEAYELLLGVPELSSVSSPLASAPEQLNVVFQPDVASTFGVSPDMAFQNISWALRGWQLPRYQEEGREIPLIIEYDEEEVAGLDTLRDLQIFTGESAVPLSSFATFEFARGRRTIYRRDGKTAVTLQARVDDPTMQARASDAGYLALSELELPRGFEIGTADLIRNRQEEELGELMGALWLSVVLVFLLMCILFEHLLLPASVLFTIPFAVVGSFWTLYVTGTTMDSVGWIGIIILVGVVVNNGIVLIHRIHTLRGDGVERRRAVMEGCANRVRPILMTAMTTVFGLVPMATAAPPSQGIDYRALATCVAGGLAISTFFTLWVVPLAYTLLDDLGRAVMNRLKWAVRVKSVPTPAEPAPALDLAGR